MDNKVIGVEERYIIYYDLKQHLDGDNSIIYFNHVLVSQALGELKDLNAITEDLKNIVVNAYYDNYLTTEQIKDIFEYMLSNNLNNINILKKIIREK